MSLTRRRFAGYSSGAAAAALTGGIPSRARSADNTAPHPFRILSSGGMITSLKYAGDTVDTDYIAPEDPLGALSITWRPVGDPSGWVSLTTSDALASAGPAGTQASCATVFHWPGAPFSLRSRFSWTGGELEWSVSLANEGNAEVEIGDLAFLLPMNTNFDGKRPLNASVLKHHFIAGSGSFIFWMRPDSIGPYLMMVPQPGTHLEYWDTARKRHDGSALFAAYAHARAAGADTARLGGTWRQPLTSTLLKAGGQQGSTLEQGLRFSWCADYQAVRDRLVQDGLIDVLVMPGMVVPTDLDATIALRSDAPIGNVTAEHDGETTIAAPVDRGPWRLYTIRFNRTGENRLTIRHGAGLTTYLEFFVTEPIETLIRKRGSFIARHQHQDPSKWYRGLFAEWNMQSRTMLGPDNYDQIRGWRRYEVTCDDPGLSKPAFLATKNALYPEQDEIRALDDYIEHFVWGGLQRTTRETFSYGIYGIPDWKTNRESPDPGPKGQEHLWRVYDYPHVIVLYFGMYRIAHDFPNVVTRMSSRDYLERAAGTAIAMFTVPNKIVHWSPYDTGYYNECVLPALIQSLQDEGMTQEARTIRDFWERKVRTFITTRVNLFASEYAFDSTGFESTQALARYAFDQESAGRPIVSERKLRDFSRAQLTANLFCRGTIEPAYYYLGSDYRGAGGDSFVLTYMSQMGGGAVLDYALHDAQDLAPLIRIGYASYLSAWSLINSGPKENGYGYWYPGEENDGGSSGGFEPAPSGRTWLGQPHHRGPWYYACESDLGYCGAVRTAVTIVTLDPVFGLCCYGGNLTQSEGGNLTVIPRDGVRQRLAVRLPAINLDVEFTRERFAADVPIQISNDGNKIEFSLESSDLRPHPLSCRLRSAETARYRISSDGWTRTVSLSSKTSTRVSLPAYRPGSSITFHLDRT